MKLILNELSSGKSVQIIGKGNSMNPLIKEGDIIKISPYNGQLLKKRDIVLARLGHNKFLTHQILDIEDSRYLIGNASDKEDGWITIDAIYGIIVNIGKDESFDGLTIEE